MKILNSKENKSLNKLKPWAILIILVIFSIGLKAQPDGIKIAQPRVFGASFKKNLYQAELTAMNHAISGLLLIKKTGITYRAVFMSEIGLKYFDIEVGQTETGDYKVHYMMEMLNRRVMTEFFEKTLRMVTLTFGDVRKEESFFNDESGNTVQAIKTQHGKFSLDYQLNSGYISTMTYKRFLKKTLIIKLSSFSHLAPASINIDQKKIQLFLKQIEN